MSRCQVLAFFAVGISSGLVAVCIFYNFTDKRAMLHEAAPNAQAKVDFRYDTQTKNLVPSLPSLCKFTNTGDSALIVQKKLSADMLLIYDESGNEVIPESRFEHVNYSAMAISDYAILNVRGDYYESSISSWSVDRDDDNAVLKSALFQWRIKPGAYSVVMVIPAIDTVKTDSGRLVRVGQAFGGGARSIELVSNPIILHIR